MTGCEPCRVKEQIIDVTEGHMTSSLQTGAKSSLFSVMKGNDFTNNQTVPVHFDEFEN